GGYLSINTQVYTMHICYGLLFGGISTFDSIGNSSKKIGLPTCIQACAIGAIGWITTWSENTFSSTGSIVCFVRRYSWPAVKFTFFYQGFCCLIIGYSGVDI